MESLLELLVYVDDNCPLLKRLKTTDSEIIC